MVTKGIPYENSKGYLYLDQNDLRESKQIAKEIFREFD
ncbi:MAG: hypothetical protein ACI9SD_001343 [Pseudohongiellaceae bacterium]|jgi:hypothetical protein